MQGGPLIYFQSYGSTFYYYKSIQSFYDNIQHILILYNIKGTN